MAVLTGEGRVQIIYGNAALPAHPYRPVYLARPNLVGVHPPVLVLHGDAGLTASVRDLCRRLARHGYVAAAPDLFRGGARGDLTKEDPDRLVRDGVAVLDAFASWSSFTAQTRPAVLAMGPAAGTGARVATRAGGPLVLCGGTVAGLAPLLPDVAGPILGLMGGGVDGMAEQVRALHDATGRGRWVLFPGAGSSFFDGDSDEFDQAAFDEALDTLVAFLDRHSAPAAV